MRDNTILVVGGLALLGYMLYRTSNPIVDTFGGVGSSITEASQAVPRVTGTVAGIVEDTGRNIRKVSQIVYEIQEAVTPDTVATFENIVETSKNITSAGKDATGLISDMARGLRSTANNVAKNLTTNVESLPINTQTVGTALQVVNKPFLSGVSVGMKLGEKTVAAAKSTAQKVVSSIKDTVSKYLRRN